MAASNPFATDGEAAGRIEDPFEDPAVASAAQGYVPVAATNPFSSSSSKSSKSESAYEAGWDPVATSSASSSSSAHSAPSPSAPSPSSSKSTRSGGHAYVSLPSDEGGDRETRLMSRERALIERERALEEREQQIRTGAIKMKNWPSACYPLAYHSIVEEIPVAHRSLCRKFYAMLYLSWLCIIWNWLAILTYWGEDGSSEASTDAMWASLFVAFGIPGAWSLWYRSIYFGLSTSSGARWVFFFY